MPKLPQVNGFEVERALRKAGWVESRTVGSHRHMIHAGKPGVRITVTLHRSPMATGTLSTILKDAGLTVDAFKELL